MLLIIPIDAAFKKSSSKNQGWLDIVKLFPKGISGLASLALLWREDKDSFLIDAVDMFMDVHDNFNDNDLELYNQQQLAKVIGSDAFALFLDLFFDIQTGIYAEILGTAQLLDFNQIDSRMSNLCVEVKDYEQHRR